VVASPEKMVEVEYGSELHTTTHGSGFPTSGNPLNPLDTQTPSTFLPAHPPAPDAFRPDFDFIRDRQQMSARATETERVARSLYLRKPYGVGARLESRHATCSTSTEELFAETRGAAAAGTRARCGTSTT